jgi:hypothetical protein
MFDNNYHFGFADILCDGAGCGDKIENVEGFDGHTPDIDTLMDAMRDNGWKSRKVDGEWLHLCPACQ